VNDQSEISATGMSRFTRLGLSLCTLLIAGAIGAGCRTAVPAQPAENTSYPFDAEKVAELAHEAYKVAWDANVWARRDLRYAAFRPTALDWETVYYLGQISRKAPWVARKIEQHPTTPRVSSQRAYELVRYDAMMLKRRYEPRSFHSSTDVKIERLLGILDEIDSCYEESGGTK